MTRLPLESPDERLRRILLRLRSSGLAIEDGANALRRNFSINAWLRRTGARTADMSALREDGANEGMAVVAKLFREELDRLIEEETGAPAAGPRPELVWSKPDEED